MARANISNTERNFCNDLSKMKTCKGLNSTSKVAIFQLVCLCGGLYLVARIIL
jgi:hypothetical protein